MTDEINFKISPERPFEEIMKRSASYVDDYTLGLQFPACDFASYYLYAPLMGDGPCKAINLGVTIGHDTGSNVNIPQLTGDPGKIWIVASLIFEDRTYRSFDFTSYRRSDAVYSRNSLDLMVADVAAVRGSWPYFEIYVKDKEYNITYQLRGFAGHAHWVPDHVSTTMSYSYLLFPDYHFSGKVSLEGRNYDIEGIGSLDHVFGRNINNPTGPVVGFWHADPIMWEEKYVSNGLFYLDDTKSPYIAKGVTTIPDDGYHPGDFEIEYLDFATGSDYSGSERDCQVVPYKWRAKLTSSHGILTYETSPLEVHDPKTGGKIIEPCIFFNAEGEFRGNDGKVKRIKGKGYNEYESGVLDPREL